MRMIEDEKKSKRLAKVREKKGRLREKLIQKKLTETWSLLPEREKSKFRSEEKKKRMELKEVKENLWR